MTARRFDRRAYYGEASLSRQRRAEPARAGRGARLDGRHLWRLRHLRLQRVQPAVWYRLAGDSRVPCEGLKPTVSTQRHCGCEYREYSGALRLRCAAPCRPGNGVPERRQRSVAEALPMGREVAR